MITGRPAYLATVIRTATQVAQAWQGKISAAGDDRHAPWMPFSVPAYIALAAEALPETDGNRFLEVGCGPGPYMMLMRELFGMDVTGFDRVPEYVAQARSMGLDVTEADAMDWPGYGDADLIWLNRAFRDPEAEALLEAKIWMEARPGAEIMCANLESRPPGSWYPVLDDWDDLRRGIWQKPFTSAGS